MEVLNVLAANGLKPEFDVYNITTKELTKYLEQIVQTEYDVQAKVDIDIMRNTDNEVLITFADPSSIPEDVEEVMSDDGMNVEDAEDVKNRLLFLLGGGKDTWIQYSGSDKVTGADYVDIHFHARQDIAFKILELMDIALEGSRDQTIMGINNLLKYVRS